MRSVTILPLLLAVASARTVNFNRRADNLQTFTGDLGGAAPAVTNSGDSTKPFEVNGDIFVNQAAAVQRSCDVQFNTCADQANGGAGFSVDQCQQQKDQCSAAAGAAKRSIEERSEHITPRFSQIQVRANSSTGNDQASRVGNIKRLVEVAERGFEKIKVRANSNSTSSRVGNIKRLVDVEERDFEKIRVRANSNSTANDQANRVGNIKRNVDFEKRNGTAADFIKRGDVLDKRNNAAQNGTANFIKRFTPDMEKRAQNGTAAAAGQGNNAAQQFGQAAKDVGGIVQGLGNLLGGGGGGAGKAAAPFGLKPRKTHFFRS